MCVADHNRKNIRLGTTERARGSTGNSAKNWILTIREIGVCATQNLSWWMRHTISSRIFQIQTDHLILARRPNLIIVNKKIVDFTFPATHKVKLKENKKMEYTWKWWLYQWCFWYSHQRIGPNSGRRNGTTKSRKKWERLEKGKLQILGNIVSWHLETNRDERKKN